MVDDCSACHCDEAKHRVVAQHKKETAIPKETLRVRGLRPEAQYLVRQLLNQMDYYCIVPYWISKPKSLHSSNQSIMKENIKMKLLSKVEEVLKTVRREKYDLQAELDGEILNEREM